jgi:putative transposase
MCIEPSHEILSISKQTELLGLNRSSYYFKPVEESAQNLLLMNLIDEEFTAHPFYGSRKMTAWVSSQGHIVNRKRIQRLMRLMGLEAIYPKQNLSKSNKEHFKYPYLLRNMKILYPNQVWSTDITYVRLSRGFVYLTSVIDWHSRYVLSWKLSNSLENSFCIDALEEALAIGIPKIFNTDQGVQYTSERFINCLKKKGIKISMDGKGRALDNIFIERLWRTVKYEEIYLNNYENPRELNIGLKKYFEFYNNQRIHQSLGYNTPAEIYRAGVSPHGGIIERKKCLKTGQKDIT